MKNELNILRIAVIIALIGFIGLISVSCTPKSAMVTRAVVLDNKYEESVKQYNTKFYLIEYGVVDYQLVYSNYEVGDTVFVHDSYYSCEIK